MPLNTQIEREGEAMPLRWSSFHVGAMVLTVMYETEFRGLQPEQVDYPIEPQPLTPSICFQLADYSVIGAVCPEGDHVVTQEHAFIDTTDGEILRLRPGDKLSFWRTSK